MKILPCPKFRLHAVTSFFLERNYILCSHKKSVDLTVCFCLHYGTYHQREITSPGQLYPQLRDVSIVPRTVLTVGNQQSGGRGAGRGQEGVRQGGLGQDWRVWPYADLSLLKV